MSMAGMFLKSEFAKRFQPQGDGYVFRERADRPGYAITRAERDEMVETFGRQFNRLNWGCIVGGVVLMLGVAWIGEDMGLPDPGPLIYAVIALMALVYMSAVFQLWGAPKRRLAARTATIPTATVDDGRRALRDLSWKTLGLCVLMAAFVGFRAYGKDPTFHDGSSRFLAAMGIVLLVIAAVQAFRKWRSEAR